MSIGEGGDGVQGKARADLDSWNKELERTCARNFGLQIGTPVGIMVKERCAKNGEKRRTCV